jgi:NAD(P)-dependent dehydrogenase (short-subunit alcohol dehydrogenase family)
MTITIITGGSRGLGRSTALQCAARGSGVILTYNSYSEGADEVVRAIEADGGKAVALKLDVSDSASFAGFKEEVEAALAATWGRVDFDHLVTMRATGYSMRSPPSPRTSLTGSSQFISKGRSS